MSVEPILEDLGTWSKSVDEISIKWVIVGAETGNRKGRVIPKKEWIDNLAIQCDYFRIPIFMKDSLIPIVGEENMRREFPIGLL